MLATFFRYVGGFFNVLNRSPTSQTCHQHIWSPTSVTNIDVTQQVAHINFQIIFTTIDMRFEWLYFQRRRHFWKLDGQKMQLWYDMTHQKTHKTINLVNVLQIAMKDTRGVNHLEIRTNSSENSEGKDSVIYYVADDTSGWRLPRDEHVICAYAKKEYVSVVRLGRVETNRRRHFWDDLTMSNLR